MSTYVYFIRTEDLSVVKIGIADDPDARMTMLQVGCPYPLVLMATRSFTTRQEAIQCEQRLHKRFGKSHVRGEWFHLTQELRAFAAAFERRGRVLRELASLPTYGRAA